VLRGRTDFRVIQKNYLKRQALEKKSSGMPYSKADASSLSLNTFLFDLLIPKARREVIFPRHPKPNAPLADKNEKAAR
jgi:hypothetical protein